VILTKAQWYLTGRHNPILILYTYRQHPYSCLRGLQVKPTRKNVYLCVNSKPTCVFYERDDLHSL
jgi:hypothetical protein